MYLEVPRILQGGLVGGGLLVVSDLIIRKGTENKGGNIVMPLVYGAA